MKGSAVRLLTVSDVKLAHQKGLQTAGGQGGIRDRGMLESAVMSPQSGYYESLAEVAAAYVYAITNNHPFLDGNKRAAFLSMIVFLVANGHAPTIEDDRWIRIMRGVASGRVTRDALARHVAKTIGGAYPFELT